MVITVMIETTFQNICYSQIIFDFKSIKYSFKATIGLSHMPCSQCKRQCCNPLFPFHRLVQVCVSNIFRISERSIFGCLVDDPEQVTTDQLGRIW